MNNNNKTIDTTIWLVLLMTCGICCGGSGGFGIIIFYFLFKHYFHMKDCADAGKYDEAFYYKQKLKHLLLIYAGIMIVLYILCGLYIGFAISLENQLSSSVMTGF